MLQIRLDGLKYAIRLEKEGMAFYEASRDKAASDIGRDMFEYLRRAEEKHIHRIRAIYNTLKQSGVWPNHQLSVVDTEQCFSTIFSNALDRLERQQNLDTTDIQALELAAEFERDGEEYYSRRAEEVHDLFEKNFYTQLAYEELCHLRAIENTILMLKDPQGFFAEREAGTLAG